MTGKIYDNAQIFNGDAFDYYREPLLIDKNQAKYLGLSS